MRLKDKVAIVTGAASGMGASTAKIFAAEGAKVMCADVNDTDGAAVVGIIAQAGGTACYSPGRSLSRLPASSRICSGGRTEAGH